MENTLEWNDEMPIRDLINKLIDAEINGFTNVKLGVKFSYKEYEGSEGFGRNEPDALLEFEF